MALSTSLSGELCKLLGEEAVLSSEDELLVYECDGYVVEKNRPDLVVFPESTQQVSDIVRLCNENHVPFLPRGAGTSLAGGSGKIMGTLVGALILGVIANGMNLTGVTTYPQMVVFGLLILVAVLIDQLKNRKTGAASS